MPCFAAPVETASLTLQTSRAASATDLASHGAQYVDTLLRVDAPSTIRSEVGPLSVEQARRFLVAVAGHRLEAVCRVTIAVGLRLGEGCGLRSADVDLAGGRLPVRETLGRVDGHLRVDRPKSPQSRRWR